MCPERSVDGCECGNDCDDLKDGNDAYSGLQHP